MRITGKQKRLLALFLCKNHYTKMYFVFQSLAIARKKPNVYDVILDNVLLLKT